MASRSSVLNWINDEEQLQVTAYLVAISPTLQRTVQLRRQEEMRAALTQAALNAASAASRVEEPSAVALDLVAAEAVFQRRCSQCHSPVLVQAKPPSSRADTEKLIARMVRNGLQASQEELTQIIGYLNATYTKPAAGVPANPDADASALVNPDTGQVVSVSSAGAAATVPATISGSDAPVDQEILVRPAGTELRFEQPQLTAKAGARLRIVLDNYSGSANTHNWVLLREGADFDAVSTAALGAPASGFVPEHQQVLVGIPAQREGGRASVDLMAPAAGTYRFGCMMPGHSFTMHGTLKVE